MAQGIQARLEIGFPIPDSKAQNYFVYPYVEVDGKEYANVSLAFSFADVPDEKTRK